MNSLQGLYEGLKKNEKYVDENGALLKNMIQEDAMNLNEKLLKTLLDDKVCRGMFFTKVNDIMVFDKIRFCWVINNKMFLPDSYTVFENNIGLTKMDRDFIVNKEDVVLSFPYKDCVLEFDSTKEGEERNEIFFNETLMKSEVDTLLSPKAFAQARKIDKDGEHPTDQFNGQDNILIKGNNLMAMHSLLPKYAGQIKLMYWDILYNTNNDTVPYNDSFKHSSWLTMMKNRLEIAKKLLRPDGVIVIECDKNEDAYLKVLMDEIFERENYINTVAIESSTPSGIKLSHKDKTILKTKDSLLVYGNGGQIKIKPQYMESDNIINFNYWYEETNKGYKIKPLKEILQNLGLIDKKTAINDIKISSNPKLEEFLIENSDKIFRKQPTIPKDVKRRSLENKNKDKIIRYTDDENNEHLVLNGERLAFLSQSIHQINGKKKIARLVCDMWNDISFHGTQYEGNENLPNGKKPEKLLLRILDMFTQKGDIVLDAYFGTGTTGVVALKMGRQFIGIEQLDEHYKKSCSRLAYTIAGKDNGNVSNILGWKGGGQFVTFELAKLNEKFVEEIGAATENNIMQLLDKILKSEQISYRVDVDKIKSDLKTFKALSLAEKKQLLFEILDKNLLYINYSDIDDKTYSLSENDKKFTKSFYEGA